MIPRTSPPRTATPAPAPSVFSRSVFSPFLLALSALALAGCNNSSSGSSPCSGFPSTDMGTGAPVTITGTIAYEDKLIGATGFTGATASRPVREAQVEVVRCSDGAVLGNDVSTDAGAFSVDVTNAGAVGAYVRVLAQIAATDYAIAVKDTSSAVYAVRGDGFDERTAPPQALVATEAAGIGPPFNILDNALASVRYVDTHLGLATPLLALTLMWEAETTDFTAYLPASRTVVVLDQPNAASADTDGYDDQVIRHEVGHFIADQISEDDSRGGPHSIGETDQDARLSWSEGWADFFGGAVEADPDYVDTFDPNTPNDGIFFSMEDSLAAVGGSTAELGVAAALWDGLDGPGGGAADTDADPSDLGAGPILAAVADLKGHPDWVEFGAFWNALRADPANGTPELEGFRSAALGNDIDLFEDNGSDDVPAGATTLSTPTAGSPTTSDANLAWDVTATSGPDVDHFSVPLASGVTYTIETTRLSDGADTALEVLDPTGTTVLTSNDNYNGASYLNCDSVITPACPVNGPFPTFISPEPLSSRVFFTPTASATYVVQVTRAAAPPPSAGLFGGYRLQISR